MFKTVMFGLVLSLAIANSSFAAEPTACEAAIAQEQQKAPLLQLELDCDGGDAAVCAALGSRPGFVVAERIAECNRDKQTEGCEALAPFLESISLLVGEARRERINEARRLSGDTTLCSDCEDCTSAQCCCNEPGYCDCYVLFYCNNLVTVYCLTGNWCPCDWTDRSGGGCRVRCLCCGTPGG